MTVNATVGRNYMYLHAQRELHIIEWKMHFIGAGGRAKVEHKYELGYALSRDEAVRFGKTTLQNFPPSSPLTLTAPLDNILMISQFHNSSPRD